MAQAFIDHAIKSNPHGNAILENQLRTLRNQIADTEFSDCDENLLVQAANEMELTYISESRKRKRKPGEDTKRKRQKLENAFICDLCDRVYKHKNSLHRHLHSHFSTFNCEKCNKTFTRKTTLNKHKCRSMKLKNNKHVSATGSELASSTHTKEKGHTCQHCGIPFHDYDSLFQHVTTNHPLIQTGGHNPPLSGNSVEEPEMNQKKKEQKRFKFKKSALKDSVKQIDIVPMGNEKYDLLQFLANVKDDVEKELISQREKHRSIKWSVIGRVEMVKDVDNGEQEKAIPHFRSKFFISLPSENNDHNINEAFQGVNSALEEFVKHGSNWTVNKVISLEVNTVKYSPISGSSYMELPRKIQFTGGIINIRNEDQKCFLWSILAALHPVPVHPERVYHYKNYENDLNMGDIEFPVSIEKIEKFEKLNNISVNVLGFEEGEIFPLHLTKLPNGNNEVDLLYLANEEKSHYCLIKNLNRFLGSTTKCHSKRYYCRRCLHGFIRQDLLNEHRPYCDKFEFQKVTYPEEGKNDILTFKDYEKLIPVPFVIFADFECYARKVDTCQPNPEKSSTTHHTKFDACGYAYVVVSTNEKYTKPAVVYRGDDAVKHFLEDMLKEEEYINEKFSKIEPLIMNNETEKAFKNATNCYVCNRFFTDKLIKVRDHDHLGVNGDIESPNYTNYRGAACQSCNLNLQHPPFIPIYFHNLRGFDMHLLMSEAGKYKDKKMTVIAQNTERYISFSLGKLRFLDSFQCMGSSLEILVKNLAEDGLVNFKQFRKAFPSDEVAKLLLQKNEYCYDYVDCAEKFNETQLPPKEAFYNKLKKEPISDERYQHAVKVWNFFQMKTLGEFHDLYVLTDCLLLCDTFQKFREMTMKNYKLDAAHFYTSPGLAWQAALKMSGITLDLLTNPFLYNMFELGIRGGVSMVSKKYGSANHSKINDFDEFQDNKHILYLDANNLYGWSMSQYLPTGLMHFLSDEEIEQFELQKVPKDSNKGYILEVDLQYPPEIHDLHNCYPLAPSHQVISDEELSPYSLNLWRKLHDGKKKARVKTKKLVPNLEDKSKYIVHYRNLQLYEELGMKITKIHRILAFHQSPWLKNYIDFNAKMRKNAKNDFEKDFFKLMCNR